MDEFLVAKLSILIHVSLREDLEPAYIGDLQIELHKDVIELFKANFCPISSEMLEKYMWVKHIYRILNSFREHISRHFLAKSNLRHHPLSII